MEIKTYKIRLTKLNSTHENMRTDVVDGVIHKKPCIYEGMTIYAQPLDPTKFERRITTSAIIAIEDFDGTDTVIVKTMNSTYKIEYV